MDYSEICENCPYRTKETIDNRIFAESPGGGMSTYGEITETCGWCSHDNSYCVEKGSADLCEVNQITEKQMNELRNLLGDINKLSQIKKILKLMVK